MTGAITAIHHERPEENWEALEQASLPIPDFIRESLNNLGEIFLKLDFFFNTADVSFPGYIVLQIAGDFVNPVGKVFSAVLGTTIQAQAITNAGLITSEQGPLNLEAARFSQPEEGRIAAFEGPVHIYTQYEMQMMGLVQATEGIKLISGEGAISFLNSVLLAPNKTIAIQTQGKIDIAHSAFGSGVILKGNQGVRIDHFYIDGFMLPVILECGGLLALHNFHMRNAELLSINSRELLSHASTAECQSGLMIRSSQEIILEEGFRALVHQGNVLFETRNLEFSDVKLFSKGSQKIKADAADLIQVRLENSEGNIKLKTQESGAYEDIIAFSRQGSLKICSKQDLLFKKATTFAKKTILQHAAILVDEESTHGTESHLTQIGDESLSSILSRLESRETLFIKSKRIYSLSLTAIAQNFIGAAIIEGNYNQGSTFFVGKTLALKSDGSLDLSQAEITAGELFAVAAQQIFLPHSKTSVEGDARWISLKGGIEAQHAQIRGSDESQEIIFKAPHGECLFDHLQVSSQQKMAIYAKQVRTQQGIFDSAQGILFEGECIQGKSTVLNSERGDIVLSGSRSLFIDETYKNASQGSLIETSEEWISERNNENEAQEILRQARDILVSKTRDKAQKIYNESVENLTITHYNGAAEKNMVFSSQGDSLIDNSHLKAPLLDMESDDLWLKSNALHFQALRVQAQNLHISQSSFSGRQAAFSVSEAVFEKNKLKTQLGIKAESLEFQNNKTIGNLKTKTAESQYLANNQFSEGNLQLKSKEGDLSLHHNTTKVNELTLDGRDISLRQETISTKQDVSIKGETFHAEQTTMASEGNIDATELKKIALSYSDLSGETLTLSAAQGNLDNVSLQSLDEMHMVFDKGRITDTEMAAASDVNLSGNQFFLSDVTAEGFNVEQQANELVNINTTIDAEQTIVREANKITIEGGSDHAKELREHAQEILHRNHTVDADEWIEEEADQLKILDSKLKAPEILWKTKKLYGSKNKVKAENFTIESNHAQHGQGRFKSKNIAIRSDIIAFPSNEFKGNVFVPSGFYNINLQKTKVHGVLNIGGAPEELQEEESIPAETDQPPIEPEPIAEINVRQPLVDRRQFPAVFEGEDTTDLMQVLLQRGVLSENNLQFIDDGTGQIDTQRIRNKMTGVTPQEQEILLRNFNREGDLFGIKHEGVHWTYLRPFVEGGHAEEPTLGDGHCAFNGFALGFCDAVLANRIRLTPSQLEFLQRNLNLAEPSSECLSHWILSRALPQRQRELHSILREIAVNYIRDHEFEIYREVYEEQLYFAYCFPQADDSFRTHNHIAQKFREPGLSKAELIQWWHAAGKAPYFENMLHSAWGGEVEIDALARYFEIYIFWQKDEGRRSIGGQAISSFNQEQIKRLLDLNIGERLGNSFQLHRFATIETLQEMMAPLPQAVVDTVERILEAAPLQEQEAPPQNVIQPPPPVPVERRVRTILEPNSGVVYAPGLEFTGKSLGINAAEVLMPDSKISADTHVDINAENSDLARTHMKAALVQVNSNNLQAPRINLQANEIVFLISNYTHLYKGKVQSKTFTLQSKDANLSKAHIAAVAFFKIADSTDLNQAAIDGSLKLKSKGPVTASHLAATGKALTMRAGSLFLPNSEIKTEQIALSSKTELAFQNATLNAAEGIDLEAKHIDAQEAYAETEGHFELSVERMADLRQSEILAKSLDMRGPHFEFSKAKLTGEISVEEAHHVNLNEMQVTGPLKVESDSIEANRLQMIGDFLKFRAKHLFAPHAKIQSKNKIKLRAEKETSLQNVDLKGNFYIKALYILNQGAIFKLAEDTSNITADSIFNSSETKIKGKGNLRMKVNGDYQENGQVDLEGLYKLKARQISILRPLAATDAVLHATQGNLIIEAPFAITNTAKLDCTSLINQSKITADNLFIHQQDYRDPGDVTGKTILELSSDSELVLDKRVQTEGSFALKSEKGIKVNLPLDVGGMGIFETPGKVDLNAQTVFKKGTDVNAQEVNINDDIHITGSSAWNCNRVNLNAKADHSKRSRYGFLRKRGRHASTYFQHDGNLDWEVEKTVNDGSNMHVKGKMRLKGVMKVVSRMHTRTYRKKVGKVKSKSWGGLRKKSKTLYATCQKIVLDLFAVLQVEKGLFLDKGSVIIEGGAFLGEKAKGNAKKISVGIKSLKGESPTSLPSFQKAAGLPKPRPGGDWQTTADTSVTVDDFYVNGYFESTQGKVTVAAKKFLVECRVAEKDEQVATISRFGRIHRHSKKSDDAQPGGHVHGAKGTNIDIEESGVLKGGTVSSGGVTRFTGQKLTLEPVVLRKVVHLKPGRKSFFKQFSGTAQMREFAGEQLIRNKRLPGMPKTPVNVDPLSYFRKVRAYSERREYVPSNIVGRAVSIDLEGNFKTTASHVKGLNGVIVRAANISKKEIFDSYKCATSQRGKEKSEIKTVTVTNGSIHSINGPVVLDANKGDLYIEGEVGSFKGAVTLKALRDILLITRSASAENKVSSTTYSFPKVTHQSHRFNTVTISRARIFGTGLIVDAGRSFITEAPDVDISGNTSTKAPYWERRGHKINFHHRTKETTVGVKFFGSEAIAAAVNERKPLRTAEELFRENPSFNLLCRAVSSKDGVAAAKNSVMATVSIWNGLSKYSKAFNNGQLANSLGYDHGITDKEGNFRPKITVEFGASQSHARWTQTIPGKYNIQRNYEEDVKVVRDYGSQFFIGGDADIKNDVRILDAEVDTFSQTRQQGKIGVGYGALGWSFSAEGALSSARGKTHTPHRLYVGGDLKMKIWDLRLNNSAYIEAEHVFLKVHHLSGNTIANTYRQKSISAGGSSDEQFSFSASSMKRAQVADVMTIKSRQPGHMTANTIHLKGGLLQNITINPEAKVHFEGIKEYKKIRSVSGQYFGKDKKKQPKEEEEGIKIWADVDFNITSRKGKVRATIAGGNGKAFGINTDMKRHHTKGKKRNWHVAAPIGTFDKKTLEANFQEISKAFGFPDVADPAIPKVQEVPKTPFARKFAPKRRKETPPIQNDFRAKKTPKSQKPEASPLKQPITESKRGNASSTYLLGNTVSNANAATMTQSSEKETAPILRRSFWKQITDPALQLAHLNAQSTLVKIGLLPLTIESFSSSNAKRSFKQQITDLSLELLSLKVKSTMTQARLFALPLDGIAYSIEKTIEDLNHACETSDSPILRRNCRDIAQFRQSVMGLAQRLGVTDLFKTIYSAYTSFVDHSARVNRFLNIDDDMTRIFYSDVIKIATAVIPLPHISKAVKLPPLKPTILPKDAPVIPGLIDVTTSAERSVASKKPKATVSQSLPITLNQPPNIERFISKITGVLQKDTKNPRSLCEALGNQREKILKYFPDFSYLGDDHQIWSAMINQGKPCAFEPTIQYLRRGYPSNVVKVTSNQQTAIIKELDFHEEVLGEVFGLKVLHGLELRNLQIPQLLSFGKSAPGRFTVAKTYLEGDTLGELLEEMGSYPLGTRARQSLFSELNNASFKAGRALGELQSKGLKYAHNPSPHVTKVSSIAGELEENITFAQDILKDVKLPLKDPSRYLDTVVAKFEKDPGIASFSLQDIGADQFVWSKETSSFGHIDAAMIPSGLDLQGRPTFFSGYDYHEFRSIFDTVGLASGLTMQEATLLKNTFDGGFYTSFTGRITAGANEFFDFYSAVNTLDFLAEKLSEGKIDREIVKKFLNQTHRKIQKPESYIPGHFNPIIINKRTRLIPEHLGIPSEISGQRSFEYLKGWVTLNKKEKTLKVQVNELEERISLNFKKAMSHLFKLAKYNRADILQIEATFSNDKLERVLETFYGKPQIERRRDWKWSIFKIPVPKSIEKPHFALNKETANKKQTLMRFFKEDYGLEIKSELPSPKKVKRRNKNCPERIQDPIIYEKMETGEQKTELVPLDKSQPPLLTHDLHYVQKVIDNGYAIIRKERDTSTLDFAIDDFEREIAESFHDYTYLANTTENLQTREKIWTHLVDRGSPHSTKPKIEYLHTYADEKDCLVKVEVGHSTAIVKDMDDSLVLNELFGLHAMRSLELKHFTLPQPLAVGKYKTIFTTNKYVNSERYFFIRAHMEGDPFDNLIQSVCKHPLNSEERNSAFIKLAKATLKLGKGVGELQSKGLKYKDSPSLQAQTVNKLFRNIEELHVEEAQETLKNLKIPFKDPVPYLEFLAENFEKDRGFITYTLADVQLEHFIVSETGNSIGLVDFAQIPMDLDLMNKPRHFGAKDFYEILSLFDSEGLSAGLTFEESHMLKKAFKKGYFSQIENHFSKASQQFFDFGCTLRTLNDLAQDLYAGKITDRKLVRTFAHRVNSKITQFNEDITPKRLPKLNQPHLLAYNPHPPAIQEFIHNAFELAEQAAPKESYAIHALIKAEEQISKIIPDVSHLGDSSEAIWLTMVHGQQKRALLFQIEYFELNPFFRDRGNVVARIECQGKSTIVKQKDFPYFIGEVGALDKLHSLLVENMQFPKIEAVGKNGEQYILAKTNLEGITFKDFLKGIGEKTSLLQQFCPPCHQFGKGMGELQSKGLKYRDSKLRSIDSLQLIDYHSASLENTQSLLKDLNLSPLELDHGYFTLIAIHFEKNPGDHTVSLVDLHSGNIIWNGKNATVGFIDCESLLTRMDHLRNPVSFPGQDFYEFLLELDVQGMHLGLTLQETHMLKQAFIEGYNAEFTGRIADTSDHLFGFSAEVRRLFFFAQALGKGIIKDKNIVENLIQSLNQKASSNEPGRRNVKKWMIDFFEEGSDSIMTPP